MLRTTGDALELYGHLSVSGVDAIVPTRFAGASMRRRILGSVLRDPARSSRRFGVVVSARTVHRTKWDVQAVSAVLSEIVEHRADKDVLRPSPQRQSLTPTPFGLHDENYPLRISAVLNAWTIDDAGWLAEAVSIACHQSGVVDDIEIAVTLNDNQIGLTTSKVVRT